MYLSMWFIRIKSIKRSMIRHVLYNFLQIFEIVYKIISIWNCFEYPMKTWLYTLLLCLVWHHPVADVERFRQKWDSKQRNRLSCSKKSSCAHSFLDEVSVLFSVKNKKQQTKAYGLIRLVFILVHSIVSINQRVFYILISPKISEHYM